MAADILQKKKKSASRRHVHMPTKQTINLAGVGAKPIKLYIAIPAILVIIAAAALISKYAVFDRLAKVSAAENEVYRLRSELSAAHERLAGFSELNEIYAHYTYSGMTAEELSRVDRSEVVALIQQVIIPKVVVDNWSVSGNQLSLSIVGSSLQTINLLVQELNAQDIVDFCTVRTASTTQTSYRSEEPDAEVETEQDVVAQVIVFLTSVPKEVD